LCKAELELENMLFSSSSSSKVINQSINQSYLNQASKSP